MWYKLVCGELVLGACPRVVGRDSIVYPFGRKPEMSAQLQKHFRETLVPTQEWERIKRFEFRLDQYLICLWEQGTPEEIKVVGIFLQGENGWYQAQKLCKVERGRLISCTPLWYRPNLNPTSEPWVAPDKVGEIFNYHHGTTMRDTRGRGMFIKSISSDIPGWIPNQVTINVEFPLGDLIYYPEVCGFASRTLRV